MPALRPDLPAAHLHLLHPLHPPATLPPSMALTWHARFKPASLFREKALIFVPRLLGVVSATTPFAKPIFVSLFLEPVATTAIPSSVAALSPTRRAPMISAPYPLVRVPIFAPTMPTVCVFSAVTTSSTPENSVTMETKPAAMDALRCAFPRRSLQALFPVETVCSYLQSSAMTGMRGAGTAAAHRVAWKGLKSNKRAALMHSVGPEGVSMVRAKSPFLAVQVAHVRQMHPVSMGLARRYLPVNPMWVVQRVLLAAAALVRWSRHVVLTGIVSLAPFARQQRALWSPPCSPPSPGSVATASYSRLRNVMMPVRATVMAALRTVFLNVDSAEMASCSEHSVSVVNQNCMVPHSPIPAIRRHAALSVLPVEMERLTWVKNAMMVQIAIKMFLDHIVE